MPRYIALLRGINVGGHRVKMDHLRDLFTELGFRDVSTFIASGNVIFSVPSGDPLAIETAIESHLEQRLGYEVATFVRSPAELSAITGCEPVAPWGDPHEDDSLYVIFLKSAPGAELRARFREMGGDANDFQVSGREVFWLIRGKMSGSPLFGAAFAKATAKVPNTMRNMTSVRRLVEKHGREK